MEQVFMKEQGKDKDMESLKYSTICAYLISLLQIPNCDRSVVIMIL